MTVRQKVMPDDHSKLVPLLPIPNRTVKRLSADDSAGSRVKVGHRQALTKRPPSCSSCSWACSFYVNVTRSRWERCDVFWLQVQFAEPAVKKLQKSLTAVKKPVYNLRLSWLQLTTETKQKFCEVGVRIIKNLQPISMGVWRRLPGEVSESWLARSSDLKRS